MIGSQLGDQYENTGGLTRVDVPLHPSHLPISALPDPKTWQGVINLDPQVATL
jgi:hypothetical protein